VDIAGHRSMVTVLTANGEVLKFDVRKLRGNVPNQNILFRQCPPHIYLNHTDENTPEFGNKSAIHVRDIIKSFKSKY